MRRTAYLALATAGCLWGTSFLCAKFAFRELSVAHFLFYRFVIASAGLVPIAWFQRGSGTDAGLLQLIKVLLPPAAFGVPVQFRRPRHDRGPESVAPIDIR